ncbi:unnamed protein product [Brachionus calyciflorus]|uniref:Integrase catalytic domain-containing protein n=1 Tax=Brachionus calyciflorus TaxID=104777 RepID=A0A814FJ66_9BILA|nr:unnamed protein product [Brachionus calyciflorus]
MKIKDANGRLARWVICLQTCEFQIVHRAGMVNEDALRRAFAVVEEFDHEDQDRSIKELDPWEDEYLLHYLRTAEYIPGSSKHQKVPIWEHRAISLPIGEIMNRVQIDLVFGLPLTKERYKGIAVVIESLKKYIYLAPLKSKTAKESARCFFKFVSIFGAAKQLLLDQGKEFLNEMMDHLLKLTGTERLTTSPYHPRTNGATELANQTIIYCLRKHGGVNTND